MRIKNWGVEPTVRRVGRSVVVTYAVPIKKRQCSWCRTKFDVCPIDFKGTRRTNAEFCSDICKVYAWRWRRTALRKKRLERR